MGEVFSVHSSQGTIENFVQETMRKRHSRPLSCLREMLKKSPVVGFDESGCYNNKKLDWAWIAQTAYVTPASVLAGRASKVLEDMVWRRAEEYAGRDRPSQRILRPRLPRSSSMFAHLLRELEYSRSWTRNREWSKQVADLLRKAIHERNTRPDEIISKQTWLDKFDELLKANLDAPEGKLRVTEKRALQMSGLHLQLP